MYKVIIFSYLFWFVLTIIFITGTTRISIFCMGYLVACFYFLLFGGDLLLKPIRSILRYWDWLIAYNVFVITMKNILSVGNCCLSSALSASVSLGACTVHWVVIKNPFSGPQPSASTKQPPFQFSIAREWQCISIIGKCVSMCSVGLCESSQATFKGPGSGFFVLWILSLEVSWKSQWSGKWVRSVKLVILLISSAHLIRQFI